MGFYRKYTIGSILFKMKFFYWIIALLSLTTYGERIKDVTTIKGARENQLVGYGLVVGLAGNGDSDNSYTTQSFSSALQRFGIHIPQESAKSKNIAAVMVTANINCFIKEGSVINVTVSSIGDAKTLQGGTLLQTPLVGADDVVYAVAQGPVLVGGFFAGSAGEGGSTIQKNHPTVGVISGGAIVEKSIPAQIVADNSLDLLLRNPDSTSAIRLAQAINQKYPASSQAQDFGTVNVLVPEAFDGQLMNFIAQLGEISFNPDTVARVVINERTGTIVATQDVRISQVAVSYGALLISITNQENVSQPSPFSQTGTTEKTTSTDTTARETRGGFRIVNDYPTLDRLTAGLNLLGVYTRDMISILQTIHTAGALQAELIIN